MARQGQTPLTTKGVREEHYCSNVHSMMSELDTRSLDFSESYHLYAP